MADTTVTTPSSGLSAAEHRTKADELRKRVDLFGKTLASVATLGTTAVGLSQIRDLLPTEDLGILWLFLACTTLIGAALAAVFVAVRLMNVAGSVVMATDPQRQVCEKELTTEECQAVTPIYEQAAQQFGYTSLNGLELRERALRRAARHALADEERARRITLADEVKTEIEIALARGQVIVVRRRARDAVSDGYAFFLYTTFVACLIAFALTTDAVTSPRATPADAKACAEAREAGATPVELGRTHLCDETEPDGGASTVPAAKARAQVVEKLSAALTTCAAVTGPGGLGESSCEPVRAALAEIMPAPSATPSP